MEEDGDEHYQMARRGFPCCTSCVRACTYNIFVQKRLQTLAAEAVHLRRSGFVVWGSERQNKHCSGNVEIKQETKKAGGGRGGGVSSIAKMPADVRHKFRSAVS